MRRPLLVLVHGILTGQTHPGWVDRLEEWLWRGAQKERRAAAGDPVGFKATWGGVSYRDFEVKTRKYGAGPWPVWNVFVKNWWLARSLANELRPFLQDGAELNFVAHSNGADVVRQTMIRLAREGFKTTTAIFVAGAIRADVRSSGILGLMETGMLERAFAYSSREDWVLRLRATWPSGHLGRVGWQRDGEFFDGLDLDIERLATQVTNDLYAFSGDGPSTPMPVVPTDAVIGTRWFTGGHSGYWAPMHEVRTFELLLGDLSPSRA